jgi:hypothetical protein
MTSFSSDGPFEGAITSVSSCTVSEARSNFRCSTESGPCSNTTSFPVPPPAVLPQMQHPLRPGCAGFHCKVSSACLSIPILLDSTCRTPGAEDCAHLGLPISIDEAKGGRLKAGERPWRVRYAALCQAVQRICQPGGRVGHALAQARSSISQLQPPRS